jgi:hypothetical protein
MSLLLLQSNGEDGGRGSVISIILLFFSRVGKILAGREQQAAYAQLGNQG